MSLLQAKKEIIAPFYDFKRHSNTLFSSSVLREGVLVFSVVASFYSDFDNENLGMAVLLNNQDTLGNWEFKAPNSEWQSLIKSEQEEKLELDVEQIFEPINICQYLFPQQQEHQQHAVFRLIPSNFLIRLDQTNKTSLISLAEGAKLPRLIFTVWDMTETWSDNILHLELSTCEQIFSESKLLSPMASFLYGVEFDCSNGPVIHQFLHLDKCGVCGSDGTSCLDCRGILYGDSTYDCGICVDKRNSSNSQHRDCLEVCGGQNTMLLF
ncbi:uncharacterized protein LOC143236501 [Tachypleus tridentatus]|uniref:uncharacterized protein LOC143236501 n=1 Tax=Tachypleus tridentatus TaxID=6853 RepID=UPI003FD2A554